MSKPGCFSLISALAFSIALLALLLAACQPAAALTSQPTAIPATKAATSAPAVVTATMPAATKPAATLPPTASPSGYSLDLNGLAQSHSLETVTAVLPGASAAGWSVLPEHKVITLQGYRIGSHNYQAQLFLYPAGELARFNPQAGKMFSDLQALLQSQKPGGELPYLPLYNSIKKLQAQVQLIDFKNGKGVRYLTQFNQAPIVINNAELVYTFQGLTADGKTYVTVVLPVTHPELSASAQVFSENASELPNYPGYVTKTAEKLNAKAANSFNPDLAKLDALVKSIEIK